MRTEEQCPSDQRYLFSDEYFTDDAIAIWKAECVRRCKDKAAGQAYQQYINWKRADNEIAVFTLYAYADFSIPKNFDVIFQLDKAENYLRTDYRLIQSIHEAWLPLDYVSHGHKHLCVFSFAEKVPDIFNFLHAGNEKFSKVPKGQRRLGFCNSNDFDSISKRLQNQQIKSS